MGLGLPDEKPPDTARGREEKIKTGRKRIRVNQREVQIANKTAVLEFGQIYQSIKSRKHNLSFGYVCKSWEVN